MRVRLNLQVLRDALARSSRSQNHWALIIGLSRGHLSDLVNGTHPYPSAKTREKLLEAFDVSFDELFAIETEGDEWSEASSSRFQATLSHAYTIDREIARGGMGSVYLARDIKLGRQVAIKVLSPEVVRHVGSQPFRQEISRTANLLHPGILPLFDAGEAGGYAYYVMPFLAEGSLRDYLDQHPQLPVTEAVSLIGKIAGALDHAHQRRIVHCDIKPENILLADGHPYLADFGISQVVRAEFESWRKRAEVAGYSTGTPLYMSPEQASGEEGVDARSDVFSLACVLFEMLSGEPPFLGDTVEEVIAGRFAPEPPRLESRAPHIPVAVADVVARAMAVSPADRFTDVPSFRHALDRSVAATGPRFSWARRLWSGMTLRMRRLSAAVKESQLMRSPQISQLLRDVQLAVRSLRRRPSATVLLVLTLAIGIGLNASMFSVASAVLLRPLPFAEPDRLVTVTEGVAGGRAGSRVTHPNFGDLHRDAGSLDGLAAFFGGEQPVTGTDVPLRANVYLVTGEFFPLLGVTPYLGATVPPLSGVPPSQALISYSLWRSAFGEDPAVLGRELVVAGQSTTIAGVMPKGFDYPKGTAVWLPADITPMFGPSRTAHNLHVVGRLAQGVSLAESQAELATIASRLEASYPDEISQGFMFRVTGLHEDLVGESRRTLLLLLAVVGVVFLIACGNMASVLLAQMMGRGREMAVRRALGANSGRLVRQLLTESLVLGAVGAALGFLVAVGSLGMMNRIVPSEFLHSGPISLDWRVALFTLTLGLVASLFFGVAPAWRAAKIEPNDALRADGEVAAIGRRRHWTGLFVIPQYAFSLAALLVAGVILKSLLTLTRVDPGFSAGDVLTVDLGLPARAPSPYAVRTVVLQFHHQLLDRVSSLPGVTSVSLAFSPPLSTASRINGAAQLEGHGPEEWPSYPDWRPVGPNYFRTTGTQLIAGRDFTLRDDPAAIPVAVVNQSLARELWRDKTPIGQRIRLSSLDNNRAEAGRFLTVVGVVADVRHRGLHLEPRPAVYVPTDQHLDRARTMDLIVASEVPTASLVPQVRAILRELDPNLPIGRVDTFSGWLSSSLETPRFRAALLGGFGLVALGLALVGVFGVISYSVGTRRREMAVRSALGAEGSHIVRVYLRQGLQYVVVGQTIGLAVAFGLSGMLQGFLYGASGLDGTVVWLTSILLAAVVLLTCYLPARRAGLVSPLEALKD